MNRTIKEATVKRYHYDTHERPESDLANFVDAYNFARRLKTLKGLTPYEFIAKAWTKEPKRSKTRPNPPNAGTKQLGKHRRAARLLHAPECANYFRNAGLVERHGFSPMSFRHRRSSGHDRIAGREN